ncbi:MAG: hypothetical protein JNM93_00735 [Bacteriovoracaceae bacterium]|nr:hypothetical protein [Bacteriovoracaceae bacterium]
MIVNVFDYVEKLEKSGFTRNQAEASLQVLMDVMNQEFATKNDIGEVKSHMKYEIDKLRQEMKHEFSQVRQEMNSLGDKLTIRLGGMLTAGLAIMFTMIQFTK